MAQLIYGNGLRLQECLRLRVKDVDLEQGTVTVHGGKRDKDRLTILPASLVPALLDHLRQTRKVHEEGASTRLDLRHESQPLHASRVPEGCGRVRGSRRHPAAQP